MKKYRLIKEYPGSPKLGTELHQIGDKFNNYWDTNTLKDIKKELVENNPEFWEEIVEKDYEILSLISNNGSLASYDEPTHLYPNPLNTVYKTREYWLECFFRVKQPGWEIYSVKRLSDGEIFTIGDMCNPVGTQHKYNKKPITKIWFTVDNSLRILSENYILGINGIEHSKKPLFTTEDGVDIYEGDTYYELITPDFHNKPCVWNIIPNKTRGNIIYDQVGNKRNGRLWFSTKEAAEEYILYNKPCLSMKEIMPVIEFANNTTYIDLDKLTIKLKELVKSKL